ncbi:MAG: J domain-containing protein [Deltaproteobacteria bacterium]|nr:J domain-containing protein [Deltaproteobacteria bacterium]
MPEQKPKGKNVVAGETDHTPQVLAFLEKVHGPVRKDAAGDWFYANVSAVSVRLLLKSGLPGKELLWAWYNHAEREGEPLDQALPPRQDGKLLEILQESGISFDTQAVADSGWLFLPPHRQLVYQLLAEFLTMRLEGVLGQDDAFLRRTLSSAETWTDRHLARLVERLQTEPLSAQQRLAVFDELPTGYLKATARHLLDEAQTTEFWKAPPPELEELGERWIDFAQRMIAAAHRLGVYGSPGDWERRQDTEWESYFHQAGGPAPRRSAALQGNLAVLGLGPGVTLAGLKAAYRDKAKSCHPDQGGTVQDFLRVQEAYEYLLAEMFQQTPSGSR